jgi:hypothetical protein
VKAGSIYLPAFRSARGAPTVVTLAQTRDEGQQERDRDERRSCRAAVFCGMCGEAFVVCGGCERGQRYCKPCRLVARKRVVAQAKRRHAQSEEGLADHRDHQRAHRERLRDLTTRKLAPARKVVGPESAPDSTAEPADVAGERADAGQDHGDDRPGARPGADPG